MSAEQPRGIYSISTGGEITTLAKDLGRLDGLYQMDDGTLLITDWTSGSLLRWNAKGTETLAKGFKGPADFCVVPRPTGSRWPCPTWFRASCGWCASPGSALIVAGRASRGAPEPPGCDPYPDRDIDVPDGT